MNKKIATLFIMLMYGTLTPVPAPATDWWGAAQQVLKPTTQQGPAANLTDRDMTRALRDALQMGTEIVVQQLGRRDGFNLDPQIHIPLPGSLQTVDKYLGKIGMSSLTDDLELRLNRAAELATPRAKELFVKVIRDMTFDDARAILTGPDNSATLYLRKTMGPDLVEDMEPIVRQTMMQVGAVRTFDKVMGRYNALPLVPKINADINAYVADKALDGIFYYVAQQEASIRHDPARHTTAILKRVFGSLIAR